VRSDTIETLPGIAHFASILVLSSRLASAEDTLCSSYRNQILGKPGDGLMASLEQLGLYWLVLNEAPPERA